MWKLERWKLEGYSEEVDTALGDMLDLEVGADWSQTSLEGPW